jgi:hypothetical protein
MDRRSGNGRYATNDGRRTRGTCLRCEQPGLQLPARGLCWTCYRLRSSRAFPTVAERSEWSPRELANAVEMARQGLTRREIARELGRTLDSVRAKLGRITTGTVDAV